MKLKVTRKDIVSGLTGDEECCPIALALEREYPDLLPSVSASTITLYEGVDIYSGDVSLEFLSSPEVRKFILDFDEGRNVKPTSFELMEIND